MREIKVRIHEVARDGLPDMDRLVGRVAFLFDGNLVGGWPVEEKAQDGQVPWEADSDVGRPGLFWDVTHWIEFPRPFHRLER